MRDNRLNSLFLMQWTSKSMSCLYLCIESFVFIFLFPLSSLPVLTRHSLHFAFIFSNLVITTKISSFSLRYPYLSSFFPITGLSFGGLFGGGEGALKACRRRKARTVFSDHQLGGLEKRFAAQRYLSTPERVELASSLNLSETQVSFLSFHSSRCYCSFFIPSNCMY